MDFYRAQDEARRKTGRLVLLFVAAVVTLILLTNALVAIVYVSTSNAGALAQHGFAASLATVPLETWIWVTLSVIAVIALGSGFKILQLSGGGRAVAESLGGRQITPNTQEPNQRRLLNVVEEMSLAAGIPVPPVYLLPEPGINAFAAGFGTGDAVLGINQGTIDQLNRDELQGVVAHEYSHLLNGDTRINLRLIALLHGILFLGLVGRLLTRGGARGSSRSSGSSGGLPLLALGLGLLIIGYGGTFFGNLIKAAVSRQREFLADGAAVQFTRNPQGIAGALKKIGGWPYGSEMTASRASEASHMYFSAGLQYFLSGLMATHPPLPKRISAIDPNWDGQFVTPETAGSRAAASATERTGAIDPLRIDDRVAGQFAGNRFDVVEQRVSTSQELVGNPSVLSHDTALAVLDTTQNKLLDAAHSPFSARSLTYAMLLSNDAEVRHTQIERLQRAESTTQVDDVRALFEAVKGADDLHRLSLLNASMPALKASSKPQYQRFLRAVTDLIKADARIDLFEWVMHRVLVKDLRPHFERPRAPRWNYGTLSQVAQPCAQLLSSLACKGNRDDAARERAFAAGIAVLGFEATLDVRADPNFVRLNKAVNALRLLTPLAKPKVIKACAATVLADELVTVSEGALLQGISATLDCPLPPAIYSYFSPGVPLPAPAEAD